MTNFADLFPGLHTSIYTPSLQASILEFFSLDLLLQIPVRATLIALTALAPPPTVPQDSSSTPQFSPPSVSSASLPGSPTMSEAFDTRLAHLEQASQSQSEQLAEILAALQGQNPPPPTQPPSQHPTQPPSSALSSTPPSHHFSGASHAKASPPGIFDSQCSNGRVWWTSAIIYASTVRFQDDIAKIMWALSYFQTGCAATYCQSLIDHDHLYGSSCFDTWKEFEKEFIREFMPEDEGTQASLTLEGVSYFQGTASVDKYVDNFHALITMAGLTPQTLLHLLHIHFSAACPDCQHEHVRVVDMSFDDWQEIAEAYMAFQDFQAAPMNEPAQEDFAKDQE
ncbi:hypothetical protein D9758_017787 [Tetrapyrgos nigripes]|uniref:Retrotransposon gag domain-containing protein n=1 Tax=Tetrapyrgos nigripes TaxID=182062 RepID=A0A8H5F9C2_9AGAR|nr:hypothetical protein D9758_017787 [Tetrapyrgos nigripes]